MDQLQTFNQYRPRLFAIAYRMLGSVSDAEDMIQEAWVRWQQTKTEVRLSQAYLSTLITRLCINHRESAAAQREQYVGAWLPEPLLLDNTPSPLESAELAESLTVSFLLLLECLSPTERAVFLLREVFGYDYPEIATIVDKTVPNCRQMLHRAKTHLALRRPTVPPSLARQQELIENLLQCWQAGDVSGLMALMTADITARADSGGKVTAIRLPIQGALKVAKYLVALSRSRFVPSSIPRLQRVNGQVGLINFVGEHLHSVTSFEYQGNQICGIYTVLNPDKLPQI
jgi:RNA polymerase sigma-70 factor, ECF subfamily